MGIANPNLNGASAGRASGTSGAIFGRFYIHIYEVKSVLFRSLSTLPAIVQRIARQRGKKDGGPYACGWKKTGTDTVS